MTCLSGSRWPLVRRRGQLSWLGDHSAVRDQSPGVCNRQREHDFSQGAAPRRSCSVIVPSCSAIRRLTTASASPVRFSRVLKNGSKMRSWLRAAGRGGRRPLAIDIEHIACNIDSGGSEPVGQAEDEPDVGGVRTIQVAEQQRVGGDDRLAFLHRGRRNAGQCCRSQREVLDLIVLKSP